MKIAEIYQNDISHSLIYNLNFWNYLGYYISVTYLTAHNTYYMRLDGFTWQFARVCRGNVR